MVTAKKNKPVRKYVCESYTIKVHRELKELFEWHKPTPTYIPHPWRIDVTVDGQIWPAPNHYEVVVGKDLGQEIYLDYDEEKIHLIIADAALRLR